MTENKKILVLGEETQILTIELRKLGYDAYSNDLKPCSGQFPEWHIQADGLTLLNEDWYQIFAFPPCTYLCKPQLWMCQKSVDRKRKQIEAIDFVKKIYYSKCPRIVIENPEGILQSAFKPYTQQVQPFMFGDPWRKEICLWLKGVPGLKVPPVRNWSKIRKPVANRVNGRMSQALKSEIKSKFFPLLAKAMAEQLTKPCLQFQMSFQSELSPLYE